MADPTETPIPDDEDNGGDERHVDWYRWLVTPLILFFVVALAVVLVHRHRKRRLRQHLGLHGSSADPEQSRRIGPDGRAIVNRSGPLYGTGGFFTSNWNQSSSSSSPAPARPAPALPIWRRRDDDLNELGEAPPPYDPKKGVDRPDSIDDTNSARLQRWEPWPASATAAEGRRWGDQEDTVAGGSETSVERSGVVGGQYTGTESTAGTTATTASGGPLEAPPEYGSPEVTGGSMDMTAPPRAALRQ